MTREDRRNAAVSETLGYILLFGIVTLSMGVVYAIGYPALQSNIDANVFESAEQNFIVMQSNIGRVAFDQTPVKELKIKLQSSSIEVNNESSIKVTYDDGGNSLSFDSTGEIQFQKERKTLTYEGGGVFKSYPPASTVLVSKPPIYLTEIDGVNVTTIGLVSLNGNYYTSGRGIATLTFRHDTSNMTISSDPTDVTVQINSTHAPKWEEYLKSIGFDITTGTGTTPSSVVARKNNTMVILSEHVVNVEIN